MTTQLAGVMVHFMEGQRINTHYYVSYKSTNGLVSVAHAYAHGHACLDMQLCTSEIIR